MGNQFFISKKLKIKIEKDIRKRNAIEDRIDKDLELFKEEIDDDTVLSIFKYIEEHGNKNQRKILADIMKRFDDSELLIEDTLKLVDWYDKMCDFYNNKDE